MKQRLGGLLAIALGAVLISSGLSDSTAGSIGSVVVECGIALPVGASTPNCPTAVITFNETTTPTPGTSDPQPPSGGWTIKVTSTCNDPVTLLPLNASVVVPDNGTKASAFLEVYTDTSHNTKCAYNYSEQNGAGFVVTYDPVAPIQLDFSTDVQETNPVDITNAFVPSTPSSSSSAPTSASASPSSSSGGQLADTGPRTKIGVSLWFGIALCLLGVALVFGGAGFRRRGNHT
jgi:hypothetical protein